MTREDVANDFIHLVAGGRVDLDKEQLAGDANAGAVSDLDVNVRCVVVEGELQEAVEIFHASAEDGDAGGAGAGKGKVELGEGAFGQVEKKERDLVTVFDRATSALDNHRTTGDFLRDTQFDADFGPFGNSAVRNERDAFVVEIESAVQDGRFARVFALQFCIEDT